MRENTTFENIVGKYYNYAEQIPKPDYYHIGKHGSFSQLEKNMKGLLAYGNLALENKDGVPLGRNYFIRAGVCGDGSPKWDYIRNIPDGDTIFSIDGDLATGLVPGMLEDIEDIHPFDILRSLYGKGIDYKSLADYDKKKSTGCKEICRKEKVCTLKTPKTPRKGCIEKNTTHLVSDIYDETRDLNHKDPKSLGVFCSEEDKKRVERMVKDKQEKNYELFTNMGGEDLTKTFITRIIMFFIILFVLASIHRMMK